jgi:hypothetical protein
MDSTLAISDILCTAVLMKLQWQAVPLIEIRDQFIVVWFGWKLEANK